MTLAFIPHITPLEKRHNRRAFSCGKTALDTYLKERAGQDLKRRSAAVFVLQTQGSDDIIAFYALSSLSIDPGSWPADVARKMPKVRSIPCTLLGQFAVASEWQGKGVSNWLFGEILHRVWQQSRQVGSFALVVDAVDDSAAKYWQHMGFIPFPSTPARLFQPMATIGKLFG